MFRPYDKEFADRCQAAANTAWAAAEAHPDVYASDSDSTGGGAYGDQDVEDEFYWAAAELYLTTGKRAFLDHVAASAIHTRNVFGAGGFGWQSVGALGKLDLATVPSKLPAAERDRLRTQIVDAAEAYLATVQAEAYGHPLPANAAFYNWGSNSGLLNNVVVLVTAHDLTGKAKYRDGALQGVDYIFGRNALNHSYVTGYGTKTPQNQHSRIFGHQLDPKLPNPPPGSHRRRAQRGAAGSVRGAATGRVPGTVLLRRRHPVVLDQRGRHQLELGAVVGVVLPRRPGRTPASRAVAARTPDT